MIATSVAYARFIPAPAGNTAHQRHGGHGHPVHPRACGEHSYVMFTPAAIAGSSPRLRGTRVWFSSPIAVRRFIPTPAGNTSLVFLANRRAPVHPRACGEHQPDIFVLPRRTGSSPRLRGTPGVIRLAPGVNRFIPAPAGNTRPTGGCPARSTVHPRACGEHRYSAGMVGSLAGSSPRLRGTRQRICAKHDCVAVHPRACGEHKRTGKPMKLYAGSSPRLRGTRGHEYAEQRLRRFIPAPAGNTHSMRWAKRLQPVHPRACGEHPLRARLIWSIVGSSPRLRGTPAT